LGGGQCGKGGQCSGAQKNADECGLSRQVSAKKITDPELAEVTERWAELAKPIKAAILAMIRSNG